MRYKEIDVDANRIKKLRQDKFMTRLDLAKLTGVSRMTVYNWEQGAFSPEYKNLKLIADVLGVKVEELLKKNQ